jgi:outer membrane immunogenic protein
MKRILAATAAIATMMGAPALAADMAVKAPPAPAPTAFSWTGFYFGGNVGGATGPNVSESWVELPGPTGTPHDPINFGHTSTTSLIGGIQAGYNWQVSTNWLLGVEGDFSWTSLSISHTQNPMTIDGIILPPSFVTMNERVDWLSSIRGRVGIIGAGNWMVFGTGGVAFERLALFGNAVDPVPTFNGSVALDTTKTGWAAGAGIEYLANAHWMLRVEYLAYGFGSTSSTVIQNTPTGPATGNPAFFSWSQNTVQSARVAASYKF